VDLSVAVMTDQYPTNTRPDRGTFVQDLINHLRSARINAVVINYERNFAAMSLECLLRSLCVDIVDAQFIAPAGVIAALTPRFSPFVITVHRWDIIDFPYRWPMARVATLFALQRSQGIIAVGHAIGAEVTRFVPSSKVRVIHNAVDTARFNPDIEFASLKSNLGIPERDVVVLSVGNLIPRKSFDLLIEAMPAILRRYVSCSLVIVGDGPQRGQLEMLIRRLSLEDQVKLAGVVDEAVLPTFYSMADIFVMPSLSEGHCISILEAMSAAKPIIASAIPANAESVVDGHNGFLVEPGDVMGLAEAISLLLRDKNLREALGRNSRRRVIHQFNWKLRISRLKDFYLSVAS